MTLDGVDTPVRAALKSSEWSKSNPENSVPLPSSRANASPFSLSRGRYSTLAEKAFALRVYHFL